MKDTILNSTLIAAVLVAVLYSAVGNVQSSAPDSAIESSRTFVMEKTVVAAKRLPAEATLLASAR